MHIIYLRRNTYYLIFFILYKITKGLPFIALNRQIDISPVLESAYYKSIKRTRVFKDQVPDISLITS
jgi:hypothetical protein